MSNILDTVKLRPELDNEDPSVPSDMVQYRCNLIIGTNHQIPKTQREKVTVQELRALEMQMKAAICDCLYAGIRTRLKDIKTLAMKGDPKDSRNGLIVSRCEEALRGCTGERLD